MNRITKLFACILLPCSCLLLTGCMGPNPWTVDPYADCRSLGLAPGTLRFSECLLASKDVQGMRRDALTTTTQKSAADMDSLAAQRLQTRSCSPTTGLCTSGPSQ
jgi:hypothetical protein